MAKFLLGVLIGVMLGLVLAALFPDAMTSVLTWLGMGPGS